MSISSTQATVINKMNKAAQQCALGTAIKTLGTDTETLMEMRSGSMSVTAIHANASALSIPTGVETSKGFVTDFYRSGSKLYHTAYMTTSACTLTIMANAGYTATLADRINWIAY